MIKIGTSEIPSGTTWNADPAHSTAGFVVRHAGISKVRGTFADFTATVETGETLNETKVSAVIKADSFTTGNEGRDNHVKGSDFFEAETYPELIFTGTKITQNGSEFDLEGELTIKGISKTVTFNTEFNGLIVDAYGLNRIGLEAETTISRKDFGMTWGSAVEASGILVSDKVKILLDLSFVQETV